MKKLLFALAILAVPMLTKAQDLKNYAGTYTFENASFSKVEVSVENGKLFGYEESAGKHELKPAGTADVYNIDGMDGQFIFGRNPAKVVVRATIKVEGNPFEGKRVFPAKTDYAGVYTISGAPFEKLTITVENGALQADAPGVGKGELLETSNIDEFLEPNNDAIISFSRENKEVTALVIAVQGSSIPGTKQKAGGNTGNEYAGKYVFEEGSPIDAVMVELKDGKLYGSTSQGSAELRPTSTKDEYDVIGYDGKATFKRDSMQKISGLTLAVQGASLNATKK